MGYREDYEDMRAGAVKVEGPLLKRLTLKCQENPWLKINGVDFEDDPFMESDYPYYLEKYDDRELLKKFFIHGNWSVRSAVMHGDLIFVNQVNGGDEWWTLKVTDTDMVAFESLSCRAIIMTGNGGVVKRRTFDEMIDGMLKATPEQCKAFDY